MERVEEFTQDGKNFIYIDFSGLKSDIDFTEIIKGVKMSVASYPERSLYTITNIENVRFDTNTKEIVAKYMEHNKPYVRCGAVVGLDGIKKMLVQTVMKLSGRSNLHFAFTKKQAIEWLLEQP